MGSHLFTSRLHWFRSIPCSSSSCLSLRSSFSRSFHRSLGLPRLRLPSTTCPLGLLYRGGS
ncbi:hypothetical protein SK128_009486 [Halocaridina rubra]|uniref:Uncharacterized protein n=1 Tax=Halocaridina rubra TaxID=373956 RepID=A0AAN8X8B8_HALRR